MISWPIAVCVFLGTYLALEGIEYLFGQTAASIFGLALIVCAGGLLWLARPIT